ncbi:MAG: DegT/DnrJ/EryC1/StrS family aminotransferase [Planctomycetota bacterium]|jgi:dTDP-4-amino-4,6-dideoxygalactose transaminase
MRSIGMLDLATEYKLFQDEIHSVINAVLESQHFIGGPAIGQLEEQMAAEVGVAHAVAVSSGTDALLCALMSLDIGPGDEVILPAFTFFATAGVVARLGATPVFVDIDPRTFNVTPQAIEQALSSRTRAIIVVHLYGLCADMDAISALARKAGVTIVEDAAQAIGATIGDRKACTFGDVACVSFYPTKNLGGFGEGGMIFSDDDALATVIRQLRSHGESSRYVHDRVGGNFRLDTMKAAVLQVKSRYLADFNGQRKANAARYDELLAGSTVVTPFVPEGLGHVYHQYTLQCAQRDQLQSFLKDRGIGSTIYYPIPLHRQPCFESLGYAEGSLPVAEAMCGKVLSIPCHPMLTEDDLSSVASSILEFYKSANVAAGAI